MFFCVSPCLYRIRKILGLIIVLSGTVLGYGANGSSFLVPAGSHPTYEELYQQFLNLTPNPEMRIHIRDFTFQRDVSRFVLKEGELIFCMEVNGRICAAVFQGQGHFLFSPPTQIERQQLLRFYSTDSLDRPFNTLFIIFADSTFEQFTRHAEFSPGQVGSELVEYIKESLKYLGESKGKNFRHEIMKTFLDDRKNGLFYAHFSQVDSKPLVFEINPYSEEEVRFMRRDPRNQIKHLLETINQFHIQADYASSRNLERERKWALDVQSYKIVSRMKGNLDFSAMADVTFQSLQRDQRWIYFTLYPQMEVDSVFWETGRSALFFKEKENPFLWVACEPALRKNEIYKLRVYYHGDIVERTEDWIYVKSSTGWYPRHGVRDKAEFDLTFYTPPKYQFVSVGKKLSSDTTRNSILTHWVTPLPIRNAGFNIGLFEKTRLQDNKFPPITVLMSNAAHLRMARRGLYSERNIEWQIARDIRNSMGFFQFLFGRCPVAEFYATEIPYFHGEAFPGLIHLSATTFIETRPEGFDEIFRAHEVAHQWWGIAVDFQTYHDQWLSEAFSQYCALWYLQKVREDNKFYLKILKEWRKEILQNRKFLFGSGQEAGPIWLGYRTHSSETQGDYDLIIYKKGAWVLHMLRQMLQDLNTGKDTKFIMTLRKFYRSFMGKSATTEDFRHVLEQQVWQDMGWFFDQWIYGTDIPTYEYAYRTEKQSNGHFRVSFRVRQVNVPPEFQMYVPIRVQLRNGVIHKYRYLIKGPITEFVLPDLLTKPKKVFFNDSEAVLCEVKKVGWRSFDKK